WPGATPDRKLPISNHPRTSAERKFDCQAKALGAILLYDPFKAAVRPAVPHFVLHWKLQGGPRSNHFFKGGHFESVFSRGTARADFDCPRDCTAEACRSGYGCARIP